jgi:predicted nucleotide-binding protein
MIVRAARLLTGAFQRKLMNETKSLQISFLALEEMVRAIASQARDPIRREIGQLSRSSIKRFNELASTFNKIHPEAPLTPFSESSHPEFSDHPQPLEMLTQIKVALQILSADSGAEFLEVTALTQPAEKKEKPRVFIGCSVEGLQVAKVIQLHLYHNASVVIWHQGVFGLSRGTLETLVSESKSYHFAILVLTPDDVVVTRGENRMAARDNVLFELGLFMGTLGREHTFIVCSRELVLPSDLAGITPAYYEMAGGSNLEANLGPVCTKLEIEMGVL